ncbi:MAG: glycosyltransferase [Acidimicrobiales bacterium]
MARFLFVVPPLAGHVNPTISVGQELSRRGHDVAWAGVPGKVEALLPGEARFLGTGERSATGAPAGTTPDRPPGLRTAAAFKFLWEQAIIPLAWDMIDGLDAVVEAWRPDVLVADQYAIAGGAVAMRRDLPWATSATTSAGVVDPLAELPMVQAWVDRKLGDFQAAIGGRVAAASPRALECSGHLVLVFSSRRLVGDDLVFPPYYAFVGPALSARADQDAFPWGWLDPDVPHVLVSLGTVNADAGARFFAVAAEALGGEPLQAVLVAPPEMVPTPADNVLVRERVPQLALLADIDVVVTHGGHNTVCEALAHGLPLVVAPIRDDQPVVASQVVRAGAGLRVRFGRVRPDGLRAAVRSVLDEPGYRTAAVAVQQSFETAGGAPAAADRLEQLSTERGATAAGRADSAV